MSLIIPVLGMHRSGTSCLMRILYKAGVYLGEELIGSESSNMLGHWESWEAVHINDEILKNSGGSWEKVPQEIKENSDTSLRIRRFVDHLGSHAVAAWKDPRTTLTFHVWRKYLSQYVVLVCFRHPLSVAHSLKLRDGWPLEKGIELWREYNQRLLKDLEGEKNVFWFDYDMEPDSWHPVIDDLCGRIGVPFTADLISSFNSKLKNHAHSGALFDSGVDRIYEQFKQNFLEQIRPVLQKKIGASKIADRSTEESFSHTRAISELTEIYQGNKEIQQRSELKISNLQREIENLKTALRVTQTRLEAQQKLTTEVHGFMTRVRQTFFFRSRRLILRWLKRIGK